MLKSAEQALQRQAVSKRKKTDQDILLSDFPPALVDRELTEFERSQRSLFKIIPGNICYSLSCNGKLTSLHCYDNSDLDKKYFI